MQAQRLVRQLVRKVGQRNYGGGGHGVQTTYNDLPQPIGSWQTHYDAKQRKYNAQLVVGIVSLVGTIVFGKAAGLLEFHDDIPARPADIASYK